MPVVEATNFQQWRTAARDLLASEIPPHDVHFRDSTAAPSLFATASTAERPVAAQHSSPSKTVPAAFLEIAKRVACHRDADRWERLYRLLWRLTHGEPKLLDVTTDDDVYRVSMMEKAVRRDVHKMKAFVRFRKVMRDDAEHFIAWHRPDHRILRLAAPFFSRRFPNMLWSILTPYESVAWDLEKLHFGPGTPASQAPQHDELETLWKTYYGSIFNPARIKLAMMTREMPARHWATLPETDIIPDLLADANRRVQEMLDRKEGFAGSAADFLPESLQLDQLQIAAATCQGCDLHRHATQTVFGIGPVDAKLMLVGEQPGDQEDRSGVPFVGPAGQLLDRALHEASIDRAQIYLTNAVKHFKHEPTGTRRLHKRPDVREMTACKPWLDAEIATVNPRVIVCLGGTAAQTLIGRGFRITQQRGQFLNTASCDYTVATYHPAAILRVPDAKKKQHMLAALVHDLKKAAGLSDRRPDHR